MNIGETALSLLATLVARDDRDGSTAFIEVLSDACVEVTKDKPCAPRGGDVAEPTIESRKAAEAEDEETPTELIAVCAAWPPPIPPMPDPRSSNRAIAPSRDQIGAGDQRTTHGSARTVEARTAAPSIEAPPPALIAPRALAEQPITLPVDRRIEPPPQRVQTPEQMVRKPCAARTRDRTPSSTPAPVKRAKGAREAVRRDVSVSSPSPPSDGRLTVADRTPTSARHDREELETGSPTNAARIVNLLTLSRPAEGAIDHPELGRIRVAATPHDDEVHVQITGNAEAVAALDSARAPLVASVEAANVSVGTVTIELMSAAGANANRNERAAPARGTPTITSARARDPAVRKRAVRIVL